VIVLIEDPKCCTTYPVVTCASRRLHRQPVVQRCPTARKLGRRSGRRIKCGGRLVPQLSHPAPGQVGRGRYAPVAQRSPSTDLKVFFPTPLGARIARASCTSDRGAVPHPSGRFFGPVHGGGGGGRLAAVLREARSVAAIAAPRCAAALGRARSAARTRSRAGAPSLRDTNGAERGGSSVRALRRGG